MKGNNIQIWAMSNHHRVPPAFDKQLSFLNGATLLAPHKNNTIFILETLLYKCKGM